MKILVFAPFYPPHIGGVEFFARDLHRNLRGVGVEITVFTPWLPNTADSLEKTAEAEIIRFPAWEIVHNYPLPKYWPFFWTFGFWRSFRSLWKERPDIVVSHTRFFNTSLLAFVYAKIRKIPLLHIEHGSSFVQSGNFFVANIAKIYDKTIGELILRKADRVVAISEEAKLFVKTLCPEVRCDVIHRGFDKGTIDAIEADTSIAKTPGIIRLLYIGRLISGKGVNVLIEALKNIREDDWELLIVGAGPEKFRLEEMASEFPKGKIRFIGERKWEEAISILKTTDIFINPSLTEGLPTTVAEAALCGKAIIATNVGGTRELFAGVTNEFLIPENNPMVLAGRISHLLADTDLRKILGEVEKKHVQGSYSWDKSMRKFIEIFAELKK